MYYTSDERASAISRISLEVRSTTLSYMVALLSQLSDDWTNLDVYHSERQVGGGNKLT